MMLAHFQEEEVFGRAHGVRGDEIIITTIPNIITGVTLRIPSFFSFFSTRYGGFHGWGYAAFSLSFVFFCLITTSFLVPYLIHTSLGFPPVCVICYTLLFSFSFVFRGFGFYILWFHFHSLLLYFYIPFQLLLSPYVFLLQLFVSMFLVYYFFCFALLWRTWEGSIHLFYNMGNGSEPEVLRNFKAGNSYFVYSFPTRFFLLSLSNRGVFLFRFLYSPE